MSVDRSQTENTFLDRARYPKGRKTLQAILDATYELIIADGPTAASQQAIADRAGVTQSAVRHYFPTKEDLLVAFFSTGIQRLQALIRLKLAEKDRDPRTLLLECAELHFSRIREVDDVFFFEATAFGRRNADFGRLRDGWYQDVRVCYQQLIQAMQPGWDEQRCVETSLQVLTLILGGWITAGRSRSSFREQSQQELTDILLRGIQRLIDQP
jgi:AcrR family transcriptional regulator